MRSLLLTFVLLLAASSLGVAWPRQSSVLDYVTQLAANSCTHAEQTICSENCMAVLYCVSDGEGGFEIVELETCSDGTRCSAELGRCLAGSTACGASTEGGITCHDTGYFPDPFDCTVYHFCWSVNTDSFPTKCPDGYAYNALTTDCSYHMTDSVCTDGPVPPCTRVGQSGPLATNPSIYYFCTKDGDELVPSLYKCHNGLVYDPTTHTCVDSTATAAPTTTMSTTTTAGPPSPGGYCPLPQLKVADPENCTHYYECDDNYRWLHVACAFGFYFNPVHNRCQLGFC